MTRRVEALLLALCLPLAAAAEDRLQGEVRIRAAAGDTAWVGQQQALQLELWSTGFRFGGQQFQLPEVDGGYLLQTDASTLKLSETRNGEAWQGLRYSLLLYPQRAGTMEVPAFNVRFEAAGGFGSESVTFDFPTEPLRLQVRRPPGAGPGLLVTTDDFRLDSRWDPPVPADGPLELRVGDALTLSVKRQAHSVPGMVFEPLSAPEIPGLAVYPARPRVEDAVNRGVLNGGRDDAITFVCEREGEYEIPAWRFQWWDPQRESLRVETVRAVALRVTANPAYAATAPAAAKEMTVPAEFWWLSAALLVFAAWAARRFGPAVREAVRQRRARREAGEDWAFRQVRRACTRGDATGTYNAISRWLPRLEPRRPQLTLSRLAADSGDAALQREVDILQQVVSEGRPADWDGSRLAARLRRYRVQSRRRAGRQDALVALNPPGS